MLKFQLGCVQCVSIQDQFGVAFEGWHSAYVAPLKLAAGYRGVSTIQTIAEYRTTNVSQMQSDQMCSTGLWENIEKRVPSKALSDFEIGFGVSA